MAVLYFVVAVILMQQSQHTYNYYNPKWHLTRKLYLVLGEYIMYTYTRLYENYILKPSFQWVHELKY